MTSKDETPAESNTPPSTSTADATVGLEGAGGRDLCLGTLFAFYLTGVIVFVGVHLGQSHLVKSPSTDHFRTPQPADVIAATANWDGQWYVRIARDGYSYDPRAMSSVAFFPAFPLCGRCLVWATGLDYDLALTLVSNAAFLLALLVVRDYTRRRSDVAPGTSEYTTLAMALFPVGFFFRMGYSDSLFLLLAVLVFYGLARRWPFLLVAALVGLATAVRPVGLALAPPLFLAGWRRYDSWGRRLTMFAAACPLCIWGLAAYMGYLSAEFGDPMVFVQTQANWRFRDDATQLEKLMAAVNLESIRAVYDETSLAYWCRYDNRLGPELSLQFANPIYFVGVALSVGYGAWRRWLSTEEILFAAGVLLIPYLSKSYETCMASQARYASVAFPVYLVLGRQLAGLQAQYASTFLALSGCMLGIYAALFASYYLFI